MSSVRGEMGVVVCRPVIPDADATWSTLNGPEIVKLCTDTPDLALLGGTGGGGGGIIGNLNDSFFSFFTFLFSSFPKSTLDTLSFGSRDRNEVGVLEILGALEGVAMTPWMLGNISHRGEMGVLEGTKDCFLVLVLSMLKLVRPAVRGGEECWRCIDGFSSDKNEEWGGGEIVSDFVRRGVEGDMIKSG